MDEGPDRPALRYHGSKWILAKWIIGYFADHECYVEPYGGAAAVLLQKPRSYLEVYNDMAGDVVNFFRVLRDDPDRIIHAISLTPYAKAEWELSYIDDPDPIERARRFYIRAYQAIAGATAQWNTGWRRQKIVSRQNGKRRMKPAALSFMETDHLYQVANRFRGVQIECDSALVVIKRYDSPDTLFYLDPPYPSSTRGRWKGKAYVHEMSDDDHCDLARVIHAIAGMVLISGYRCDLYDNLYSGWRRVDKQARTNGGGSAIESLWLSPKLLEHWQNKLPMFQANQKG
jgi:DNA adenine methylase